MYKKGSSGKIRIWINMKTMILQKDTGTPAAFCAVMIFYEALKACLSRYTPLLDIFVARYRGLPPGPAAEVVRYDLIMTGPKKLNVNFTSENIA